MQHLMAFGHYLFQLRLQLGFASQKLSQHTSMKEKKRNRNKKQSDRLAQNFRGTLNTGRGLDKSRTGVLKQINKTKPTPYYHWDLSNYWLYFYKFTDLSRTVQFSSFSNEGNTKFQITFHW